MYICMYVCRCIYMYVCVCVIYVSVVYFDALLITLEKIKSTIICAYMCGMFMYVLYGELYIYVVYVVDICFI